MAIPNTTPTPNELYNGEMKKMTDTELRVVLVVTRKTLGWEIDSETGMRKKEDWINKTQMMKLTGRASASVSKAINSCIKNGWIEARDKDGRILDTKEKRKKLGYGGKVYYRLGKIFLNKTTAVQKANSKNKEVFKKRTAKSEQQKVNRNKRKTITKEKQIQNIAPNGAEGGKKEKHPTHQIVDYFFQLKGWDTKKGRAKEEKDVVYSRFTRPAKDLLELCEGDVEEAKSCLDKLQTWADTRHLDWSIETVFKKWHEIDDLEPAEKKPYYRGNRAFKSQGQWKVMMPNGEIKIFDGNPNEIEWKYA